MLTPLLANNKVVPKLPVAVNQLKTMSTDLKTIAALTTATLVLATITPLKVRFTGYVMMVTSQKLLSLTQIQTKNMLSALTYLEAALKIAPAAAATTTQTTTGTPTVDMKTQGQADGNSDGSNQRAINYKYNDTTYKAYYDSTYYPARGNQDGMTDGGNRLTTKNYVFPTNSAYTNAYDSGYQFGLSH